MHGALLDAQILAQVYLAMTGGQFTLFSDTEQSEDKKNNENNIVRIDASHSQVKVIQANKAELEAHNTYFENV